MRNRAFIIFIGSLAAGCGILVPQLSDIEVVNIARNSIGDAQVSVRNTTYKTLYDLEFECGFDTISHHPLSGNPDRLVTFDLSRIKYDLPMDYITATARGTFSKKVTIKTINPGERIFVEYLEKPPGLKILRAVCVPSKKLNSEISIGGMFR